MAARRLLIIMVVLLTISTLAAALVPPPEERSELGVELLHGEHETADRAGATAGRRAGRGRGLGPGAEGEAALESRLEPGDQLALTVTSPGPGEVSVPAFGLLEFAGPGDPARFDMLVEKAGSVPGSLPGRGRDRGDRRPRPDVTS